MFIARPSPQWLPRSFRSDMSVSNEQEHIALLTERLTFFNG